jgi:hypothetical protein
MVVVVGVLATVGGLCGESQDLSGKWRFALDAADAGMKQEWAAKALTGSIRLPGALQSQGYGDEISTNTPWVLSLYDRLWYLRQDYLAYAQPGNVKVPFVCQPPRHYLGAAWYQREIDVPTSWKGKRVALFLERPHWESRVWLDGKPQGSCNSLVAPHEYELGLLEPGRHLVSIRVDNRMILPYRPDAHSVSDSLGGTWNGIVGQIELRATAPVWIEDAQVFASYSNRTARVRVALGNLTGKAGEGKLVFSLAGGKEPWGGAREVQWSVAGGTNEFEFALGAEVQAWDEFHPAVQRLKIELIGAEVGDVRETVFGLRDFGAQGRDFVINGRLAHLRGTHQGGDFALTGYPATDVTYWRKLFGICREWGLNHMRFHSFCPPEAAFTAADEMGFYLQPEAGMWNEISPGTPMEQMMYEETRRMMKAYGNHPSYVLLSPSNEPKGRWKQALPKWVEQFRKEDPRRLYTTGTGWSLIDDLGPVSGADYLAIGRVGPRRVRGEIGWFGRDYSASIERVNVPVVAHELGQWCAVPDPNIIPKFKGYFRPGNFEIFRDSLAAHGLLKEGSAYARASGRFQYLCYKEEIEANLRTPGLAGFQLLDLHDYVGQGTALVGLLDPFWETKGYATAKEFREFCSPTVPLARLTRRVFESSETLQTSVEAAHFGDAAIENPTLGWRILDRKGKAVAAGKFEARTIPIGRGIPLGEVKVDLAKLTAPAAYTLEVTIAVEKARVLGQNRWDFWVYPARTEAATSDKVLVTSKWDEADACLSAGGRVLFLPRPTDLDWSCPPLDNVPVFWNRLMNPGWGRMLGLWCDAAHPALAGFPTETHCDWQWTPLLRGARPVNLERLPAELKPVVAAVDDWNRNYRLGLIFECKVGAGRLVVCAADIRNRLEERVSARQLRRSLLDYMASKRFQPRVMVESETLKNLWFDTRIMARLGAQAEGDGNGAGSLMDGDPNTFWSVGGGRRGEEVRRPHSVTISFPRTVPMTGVVLMNRQNDRDHQGDIREYRLEASEDGKEWRELAHGLLASTWNPQTLKFSGLVQTSHLKLTALSGFGGDSSTSLAELAVIYAGPKLADTSDGEMEYKRVRSTSTDVDESGPAADGKAVKPR